MVKNIFIFCISTITFLTNGLNKTLLEEQTLISEVPVSEPTVAAPV